MEGGWKELIKEIGRESGGEREKKYIFHIEWSSLWWETNITERKWRETERKREREREREKAEATRGLSGL